MSTASETATIRGTGQHIDPLIEGAEELPFDRRPQPGPIAVLPEPVDVFVNAVVSGGGTVAPLSAETRGIVWLAERDGEALSEVLAAHPQIEWVQLPWAGVDAFLPLLKTFAGRAKPLWTSAKGAYSEPVAEHALALALAMLRQFPQKSHATSWGFPKVGESLYGRTVVLVGAGGVAIEIMRLLSVFDVNIIVVRRSPGELAGAIRTVTTGQLNEVLPEADVVILAAASTGETAHLIGAAEFAIMKPSAVLVNVARGALVDTDALLDALRSGAISGAGLDVTDPEPLPDGHPLWGEINCLITSHAADTPAMTAPLLANRIRVNVEALRDHGKFVGVVDPAAGY